MDKKKNKLNAFVALLLTACLFFVQVTPSFGASVSFQKKTPNLNSVRSVQDSYIQVKWARMAGATGYQIYRLTDRQSGFKKLDSVKGGISYVDTKVIGNTTYYYKIRAYKTVKGKTTYSRYSKVKFSEIGLTDSCAWNNHLIASGKRHTKMNTDSGSFADFSKYFKEDPATVDLLSDKEIHKLMNPGKAKEYLTCAEAKADVSLYFRVMNNSYGGYYYFGEENFAKAEKNILKWIDTQKNRISGKALGNKMAAEMFRFVKDAHFSIDESFDSLYPEKVYQYYYAEKYPFEKDGSRYYTVIDGVKWYFTSFSGKQVSLKPSLTEMGRFVYLPTQWCEGARRAVSKLNLENESGKKKTISLTWTKGNPYRENGKRLDYRYVKENGITYISVRSFGRETFENELDEFAKSGTQAKNSKFIIFDIRSNEGGGDEFIREWIKNFSGQMPKVNKAQANHYSKLTGAFFGDRNPPSFRGGAETGKMISNSIPIIVLTDNKCGSSGEGALNFLKTLENTIVIGSHSGGAQICGNLSGYTLPNSGITFSFGRSLTFTFSMDLIDYKGYEPDIWCSPDMALDAALNMMQSYGLAESKTVAALQQKIDKQQRPELTLKFSGDTIYEGTGFGSGGKRHELKIYADGKPVKDFAVTFGKPDIANMKKTAKGTLLIENCGYGNCPFVLTYRGFQYNFRWCAS